LKRRKLNTDHEQNSKKNRNGGGYHFDCMADFIGDNDLKRNHIKTMRKLLVFTLLALFTNVIYGQVYVDTSVHPLESQKLDTLLIDYLNHDDSNIWFKGYMITRIINRDDLFMYATEPIYWLNARKTIMAKPRKYILKF